MVKVSGYCVCILLMGLLFTQCKKEYSYEGGLPAVFTFVDTNGSCAGVTSGEFSLGTPLNASNTVSYLVDVTSPGFYNIQSNAQAGIQFSAAGNFGNTGIQTLTLNGAGTPNAAGDFNFYTEIGLTCPFTVEVKQKTDVNSDFTFIGSPNACSSPQIYGQYFTGIPMTTDNFILINVDVKSLGNYSIQTDTIQGLSFNASGTFTKTGQQSVKIYAAGITMFVGYVGFTTTGNHSTACTFTIQVNDNTSSAGYVLVAGQNICDGEAAGSYTAGAALTSGNTYTVQVYVADRGRYTISTNNVAGIFFSASGVFTEAGSQKVILQASGTPNATGNFIFTPKIVGPAPFGDASCDFTLAVK